MSGIVILFGAFVTALGAAGVLSPARLLDVVTRAQARLGLRGIAALRLGLAVVFWLAAEGARAPLYLRVLGGVALVSGLVTPWVGQHRFEAILDWWRRRSPFWVRLWSGFVMLFGLSMVWAV